MDEQLKEKLVILMPDLLVRYEASANGETLWKDSGAPVTEREWLFIIHVAEAKFCKDKDYWNCNSTWQERAISLFEELEKREKAKGANEGATN